MWSAESGEELWHGAIPPNRFVTAAALAFSPDGRLLAGNTGTQTVTLWDARTGSEQAQLRLRAGEVGTLAFSASGERLATGSLGYDGPVTVWDMRTRQEVYSFSFGGAQPGRDPPGFRPPTTARLAAANTSPGDVLVLAAATVPTRVYLEGSTRVAVFSADGRRVAARGPDSDILLYDAFTGKTLKVLKGHLYSIGSLFFSDDGKRLVSEARGGTADGGKRAAHRGHCLGRRDR